MRIYKLTIQPLTSFRTPLQSDTIFGHLLWALRYTQGEAELLEFLGRYRTGEPPPLLVSAGFPSGYLPVPVLKPKKKKRENEQDAEKQDNRSPADKVVEEMLHKALEDDRYLPLEQWREIAGKLSVDALKAARQEAGEQLCRLRKTERKRHVTRTAVDRITGSAREGRLFVSKETFYGPEKPGGPPPTFDVWHKLADVSLLPDLNRWWRWVERNGFGRRKSAGHGAFRIVGDEGLVEAGAELPQVANPNGFVTLSAWVPRPGDPTDVTYRTRIKRGKLAETLALPSPWKKPLLMLEPGAVARLSKKDGPIREWYGRMVHDMHWVGESVPDHQKKAVQNVVQYGYAFPLPVHVKGGAR